MEVEGYYEWNFFNDANDENDIDASYTDNSSKVSSGKWIHMIVLIQLFTDIYGCLYFFRKRMVTRAKTMMMPMVMSAILILGTMNTSKNHWTGIGRWCPRRSGQTRRHMISITIMRKSKASALGGTTWNIIRVSTHIGGWGGFSVQGLGNDRPSFVPWKGRSAGWERRFGAIVRPI